MGLTELGNARTLGSTGAGQFSISACDDGPLTFPSLRSKRLHTTAPGMVDSHLAAFRYAAFSRRTQKDLATEPEGNSG